MRERHTHTQQRQRRWEGGRRDRKEGEEGGRMKRAEAKWGEERGEGCEREREREGEGDGKREKERLSISDHFKSLGTNWFYNFSTVGFLDSGVKRDRVRIWSLSISQCFSLLSFTLKLVF